MTPTALTMTVLTHPLQVLLMGMVTYQCVRAALQAAAEARRTRTPTFREHPARARHFENAIHTGTFCRYQPDRSLRWKL